MITSHCRWLSVTPLVCLFFLSYISFFLPFCLFFPSFFCHQLMWDWFCVVSFRFYSFIAIFVFLYVTNSFDNMRNLDPFLNNNLLFLYHVQTLKRIFLNNFKSWLLCCWLMRTLSSKKWMDRKLTARTWWSISKWAGIRWIYIYIY